MDSQGPCTDSIGTVFRGSTWSITSRGRWSNKACYQPPTRSDAYGYMHMHMYIYIYTVHMVSVCR